MTEKDISVLEVAKNTIEIEREALRKLLNEINENFIRIVRLIDNSEGRLVVTGIGKSAIVAQKIVATLNSTGTPSLFMHAADAIHGDIGMIRKPDIVLCLSKSGDTDEIRVLAQLVKRFGNPLIAMTSNVRSYLALNSDYLLFTPIDKEADPNNLAPTTSTTVQMSLGDALATALLALKGFSPGDFAEFHPGGSLGKQLYLRVRDLSERNAVPVVAPSSTIRETIIVMTSNRLGATAVRQAGGGLIGIITDGDLRRMLESGRDVSHLEAKDIMSASPKTIQADDLALTAFELMRQNSITQLLVMDGDQYCGVVHLHDLIKEGFV